MTRVSFEKSQGKYRKLCISGHSGYAEEGSDIVCAAISSSVNLAVSILELGGCAFKQSVGKTTVIIETDDGQTAQLVLGAMEKELSQLMRDFPENVKVTTVDR